MKYSWGIFDFLRMENFKTIELSKNSKNRTVIHYAIVDNEDFEKLNQHDWYYTENEWGCYACRDVYISPTERIRLKMHRVIMNTPSGLVVDHINHNGLDNRKENLRNCTKKQNEMNVSIRNDPNKKSQYKGITKKSDGKRLKSWQANIQQDKKIYRLGCYYTEEGAARAYDKAAKEKFGEFAYLNFPNEPSPDKIIESKKFIFNTEEEMDAFIQGIEFITNHNDHDLTFNKLEDEKWEMIYTWKNEEC